MPIMRKKSYNFAHSNCLRQLFLILAVSTVSLSASGSLSEHSVTFEFLDFKFTRLAGQAHSAQFKN